MNTQTRSSELAANALTILASALEAGDSQALTKYLSVMSRFRAYSWNNCLLISLQRPTATRVAGFHTWLKLGRHVRKGEKGIAILAPVLFRPANSQQQEAEADQPSSFPLQRVVAFRTAYVFDVAQTEGEILPEFASVNGDPAEKIDSLKAFVCSRGILLDYDSGIAPALGVSRGGSITLLPGLAAAQEFSTLAHECAHELLHRNERRPQTNKTIRETEAEAVAFVVCQAIGLDTNTAAADYIKLYNGDKATLSNSLQFIQSTAIDMLTALGVDANPVPGEEA
ncbi:MAG TPA: ArdC family protein [Bryobacteraceae bacterium]|jgi:antirestriction protein ArdC|nr:ArdC family protein [Bryobacteraceae bacterium]